MALLKQCSSRGCYKVVSLGERYCEYHQKKFTQEQQRSYREWRSKRVTTEEQQELEDFYRSQAWQDSREGAISYCYGIDLFELYRTGKVVQGQIVHHIVEVKENKELRYEVENLIYLTDLNHKRIHKKYNKSTKDKERVQEMLFAIKLDFEKNYK